MSDNWAMDLAREEQVYSSESSPVGWNSPTRDDYFDYGYVEGYVEQEKSSADDGNLEYLLRPSVSSVLCLGYVSSVSCTNSVDACSEVSQEEEAEGRLSSKFICGYRLGQSLSIPGFILPFQQ